MVCLLFVNRTLCARMRQEFSCKHRAVRPRKKLGQGLIHPLYFHNRPIEPGYLLSSSKLEITSSR